MANYINRDDIIKWIDDSLEMCGDRYSVDQENMMELFRTVVNDCLPFADVRPVVHGKWMADGVGYHWTYNCSICGWKDGYPFNERHNFCPNCGADMREES